MIKKYIKQIEDLIHDRESFITTDEELNKIFKDDIEALKYIISRNEELEKANEALASTCSYFHKKIVNQKAEIKELNKIIEKYKQKEMIKLIITPEYIETTKFIDGTVEIKEVYR